MTPRARLFRGGSVEVAAAPSGEILAVGKEARVAAGRDAEVVEVRGEVLPGLQDAHLHLSPLAMRRLSVDLVGARSLEACLARVRRWSDPLPRTAWVRGRGWYNDSWPDPEFPHRGHLDRAAVLIGRFGLQDGPLGDRLRELTDLPPDGA